MQALEACREAGEVISVQSPFEDGPTRLVDVPAIAIDVAAQKFQVNRVGDDIGKWLAIRHIQNITLNQWTRQELWFRWRSQLSRKTACLRCIRP